MRTLKFVKFVIFVALVATIGLGIIGSPATGAEISDVQYYEDDYFVRVNATKSITVTFNEPTVDIINGSIVLTSEPENITVVQEQRLELVPVSEKTPATSTPAPAPAPAPIPSIPRWLVGVLIFAGLLVAVLAYGVHRYRKQ